MGLLEFWAFFGFCPQAKLCWALCGDNVIWWPNLDSDMMSIICGEFMLDDMWDIMGNICERAHDNLWAYVWSICKGSITWRMFG